MYKKIFYAFCIAAIAMSCDKANDSKQYMNASEVELSDIKKEKSVADNETDKSIAGIASADTSSNISSSSSSNDSILNSGSPTNIDWGKKIIKNAHVTLELKDYNA